MDKSPRYLKRTLSELVNDAAAIEKVQEPHMKAALTKLLLGTIEYNRQISRLERCLSSSS